MKLTKIVFGIFLMVMLILGTSLVNLTKSKDIKAAESTRRWATVICTDKFIHCEDPGDYCCCC